MPSLLTRQTSPMQIELLYGHGKLSVDLPSDNITVIEQPSLQALPDEKAGFWEALQNPIGSPPLKDLVRPGQKVALAIPDGTRPLPSQKLLTWLFEALSDVELDYTIIIGTGSHRPNTREELIQMLGQDIVDSVRIVNHSSTDFETMKFVGQREGGEIWMNRYAVEADVVIGMGFIEPHLWAGFSGGYKALMPGITDIHTIAHYHRGEIILDPGSTWGQLEGNPTQAIIRRYGSQLTMNFLINISMTRERGIMGYYCGDPILAHEVGCAEVKKHTMYAVPHRFPIVLTSNNGYPLDQNLYQNGKGLSAAMQIAIPGALILQAIECSDGFPNGSNFQKLLFDHESPQALMNTLSAPDSRQHDQWSVQYLVKMMLDYQIGIYSSLTDEEIRKAHLTPVHDIAAAVDKELDRIGRDAPIAVLPEGFLTIPYVAG